MTRTVRDVEAQGGDPHVNTIRAYEVYAYINLADIYFLLGEYDQAIEFANQALEIDPAAADAYAIRGNSCQNINLKSPIANQL